MTALDRTPQNINQLRPDGFTFLIKKLPTVTFFTQSINIPGIFLPATFQPNPFTKIPIGGDHVEFSDLIIEFKVDEDMKNYIEIYNWITKMGYTDDLSQYKELADKPKYSQEGLTSDISVLITTNMKNPNKEVVFREAFPVGLGNFKLTTTDKSITEISVQATFKYEKFDLNSLS